jgi:hypothetical protein
MSPKAQQVALFAAAIVCFIAGAALVKAQPEVAASLTGLGGTFFGWARFEKPRVQQ